ncbi:MAG: proline racemase family protein [Fimbriimonas sp.]
MRRVRVIDSHTEGEPTRVVISRAPELAGTTLAEKANDFRLNADGFRSGVVCEPRGADAVVGALLLPSSNPQNAADVIFFNNVGVLGMCGHGTIGIVRTLQHLGKLQPGKLTLGTPVGDVGAQLHEDGRVTVWNVPSYRYRSAVPVQVEGFGEVVGDIAYGGNWFFATKNYGHELELSNLDALIRFTSGIRATLERERIAGENGGHIDHIELFGPPQDPANNSRNFVLCPGLSYDRSPCGTGLSAKMACLAAEGALDEGQTWRQESVIGSIFEGSYRRTEGEKILPAITGRAYITADSELLFDPEDPFVEGIRQ